MGAVAILTFGGEAPLIDILTTRNIAVFAVDADPPRPLLKTIQIDYEPAFARLYSTWRHWDTSASLLSVDHNS